MIAHKKEFYGGFFMLVAFAVVLVLVFSPVFKGQNGLEYLDGLYNSISKGSAYYIPAVKEEIDQFAGNVVTVTLNVADNKRAQQTAPLFMKGGAMVNVSGKELKISGDLAKILQNSLDDADAMYYNKGDEISRKYGYDEKRVLLNWWVALHHMERALKDQKKFKEAKVLSVVTKKAVELSFNYYTVDPQKIGDKIGIVLFSLVFYVVYTLWYGFAIMFMFEGWGMRLEH
ncbi:MAG: hypothetical protein SWQ30_18835 [Thermodesulfobacteriota bacterium]|nr:hypothetical protein [Thermodesulfobacteriota bacterium]